MKQKVIYISSTKQALKDAEEVISELPKGRYELVIRNAGDSKSLQQLRALFGVWLDYISDKTGDEVDYLHRMLKAKFLARIYSDNPQNAAQEQWTELLIIYQLNGETDKLTRHAKRISISWATLKQFKLYMNLVDNYYISNGYPLPQLNRS